MYIAAIPQCVLKQENTPFPCMCTIFYAVYMLYTCSLYIILYQIVFLFRVCFFLLVICQHYSKNNKVIAISISGGKHVLPLFSEEILSWTFIVHITISSFSMAIDINIVLVNIILFCGKLVVGQHAEELVLFKRFSVFLNS